MIEPVAGFGHVDWRERAHHWHREHDAVSKERDALRAEAERLRERLAAAGRGCRRLRDERDEAQRRVVRWERVLADYKADADALRAEVARCDEELRRLGAQWAERNEALRAEVERLRKQARCGHSPWPCNCGYSGGMCD